MNYLEMVGGKKIKLKKSAFRFWKILNQQKYKRSCRTNRSRIKQRLNFFGWFLYVLTFSNNSGGSNLKPKMYPPAFLCVLMTNAFPNFDGRIIKLLICKKGILTLKFSAKLACLYWKERSRNENKEWNK